MDHNRELSVRQHYKSFQGNLMPNWWLLLEKAACKRCQVSEQTMARKIKRVIQ